jgi:hypothetical protein
MQIIKRTWSVLHLLWEQGWPISDINHCVIIRKLLEWTKIAHALYTVLRNKSLSLWGIWQVSSWPEQRSETSFRTKPSDKNVEWTYTFEMSASRGLHNLKSFWLAVVFLKYFQVKIDVKILSRNMCFTTPLMLASVVCMLCERQATEVMHSLLPWSLQYTVVF